MTVGANHECSSIRFDAERWRIVCDAPHSINFNWTILSTRKLLILSLYAWGYLRGHMNELFLKPIPRYTKDEPLQVHSSITTRVMTCLFVILILFSHCHLIGKRLKCYCQLFFLSNTLIPVLFFSPSLIFDLYTNVSVLDRSNAFFQMMFEKSKVQRPLSWNRSCPHDSIWRSPTPPPLHSSIPDQNHPLPQPRLTSIEKRLQP